MEENFESPQNHALLLALKTLDTFLSNESKKSSMVLRSCYTIASLIGDHQNKDWINKELNGYPENVDIPNYRRFKNKSQGNCDLKDSIHRIENLVGLKEKIVVWDEDFKIQFELPPEWGYTTLSRIQDRCLIFLIETITKLQYSGKMNSIIESIQKEVNDKITKINPEIDSEIQSISVNIVYDEPEKLSKVAHSCRRILKLLADKVFPPQEEQYENKLGNKFPVRDNNYMNRLLAYLDKNKKDKILESEINYLAPLFNGLRESAGEGVHAPKITKFEAEKIFILTYLIISEILKLIKD